MAGYARGRDAVRLGTLTTIAVIAFAVLFMQMTNRGLSLSQWDVHVRIPTADGLRKRDPVLYRGVNVGEVRTLAFTPAGDVLVRLHLKERIPLTRSSGAELVPLDLFGRQSLVLCDGRQGAAALRDGDTIRAALPVSVPRRVANLADRGEELLSEHMMQTLRQTLESTSAAGAGVAEFTAHLDGLMSRQERALGAVLEQTALLVGNVNAATAPAEVAELRDELARAAAGLGQLTMRLDTTAAAATAVLGSLRERQGTAGLLLGDSALYLRTTELLASVDGLVRDIKANPKKYIKVSVF